MREGPRPGPSGQRKEYPPGGLHYASLRSGPSHFATLRLTTSPLWIPPPTLVRGCTSPLEGIPSAVPGSHPYYRLFLRTRLGSDPSLLPSPLKHTYPVLSRVQGLTLCFNRTFHPRLKHTYHVLDYLQCITPCFNHPFNTPLKHTHHVLDYLQCITPCFNHPFHPRLKHTFGPLGCRVRFNAGRKAESSWAL